MRGYGRVGVVLLSCCRFLAKSDQILDVACCMACCLNRLVMDVLVTCFISFCSFPLVGLYHVRPEAPMQELPRFRWPRGRAVQTRYNVDLALRTRAHTTT